MIFRIKKTITRNKKSKTRFYIDKYRWGKPRNFRVIFKKNLKIKTTILCTGAAISFFTKDQAPINSLIDKFYLGWLVRLIFNPLVFFKDIYIL